MTARTPGQSMDFEPVLGWYEGKAGLLTRIHVEVVADTVAQVTQYEAGVFSLVGNARQGLPPAAATRYTSDRKLKGQLSLVPIGTTFWVGFNLRSGPFAGVEEGRAGRHAFSEAIDRQALVEALAYTYDTDPFNKAVCANLIAQWKKNLGVDVRCVEMDRKTFFDQRNGACAYPMFRQSWAADYDHPQNWFDYLFVTGASSSGSCYSNPNLDKLVASADAGSPGAGTSGYKVAGFLLVNDSVFGALLYGVQQYLVHPYVKGAGGNALYDYSWTGVRILKH